MAWLRWLDPIPWVVLVLVAAYLAFAPFTPEPHLVEKFTLLSQGNLVKPLDIFDLLFHSAPLVLIVLKGLRTWQR